MLFFLFIASSHLTKKTERPPLPAADTQRCIVTRPQSNVTLLGGIKSGIFSEANHVHDMDLCTRHCCLKGDCDLAFMIRDSCYLVKCGNEMLCKTKKARPSNMNPRISFVTRLEPIKFQPRELLCFLNEVFALHASTAYQCKYFCSRTCLSKDIRIRIRFTSWRTLTYINVKIALKNCNCSALPVI